MSRKFNKSKSKGNENNGKFSKPRTNGGKKFNEGGLDSTGRDNDPNYYFTSPELANQAAQLSFQSMMGFGSVGNYTVPSIMKVKMIMCPGNTEMPSHRAHLRGVLAGASASDADMPITPQTDPYVVPGKSAVNLMGDKLYTTLSQFTGRTASYGPQDVSMMILAIASFAEYSEAIRRIIGILLTYNPRNRTLPLGLVKSMFMSSGADPVSDITKQVAVYRMRFNTIISRINQIPLLDNVAFIRKSREMYQKIYVDEPSSMSQIWYYHPIYVYTLDETSYQGGTMLRADVPWATTLDADLDRLDNMATQLLESSTLNFVYADLLNMANKLNVPTWQFDYLAENYTVMPEYNATANLQLHNLTIFGDPSYSNLTTYGILDKKATGETKPLYVTIGPHIYSDVNTNNVVYNPAFSVGGTSAANGCYPVTTLVDMISDQPSLEDRIESLRFAALASGIVVPGNGLSSATKVTTCCALPDHYCRSITIYHNISASNYGSYDEVYHCVSGAELNTDLSQFELSPMCWKITGSGSIWDRSKLIGNLKFYTEVDYDYIARLLNLMFIGLFDFRVK